MKSCSVALFRARFFYSLNLFCGIYKLADLRTALGICHSRIQRNNMLYKDARTASWQALLIIIISSSIIIIIIIIIIIT